MDASEPRTVPQGFWVLCVMVLALGMGIRVVVDAARSVPADDPDTGVAAAAVLLLDQDRPRPRVASVYGGLGTWVDAFDFSPSYTSGKPPLSPSVVDAIAAAGVDTIYLQAARSDARAPGRLLETDLIAEFLLRAHAKGIAVVGWYLPLFADVDQDLDRLLAIAEFDVRGHRFDGVAVDIEFIEAVPDATERSDRLVTLSDRLRAARVGEALGAIVPPAVQLEVVNPAYWPRFPWRRLDPSYDVWLPMAYWTTRGSDTPYRNPYTYTEESVRRMRANLGRPDAIVHAIGGIGDETTVADLDAFGRALDDVGAIGASIYDWNSMNPAVRAAQDDLLGP